MYAPKWNETTDAAELLNMLTQYAELRYRTGDDLCGSWAGMFYGLKMVQSRLAEALPAPVAGRP